MEKPPSPLLAAGCPLAPSTPDSPFSLTPPHGILGLSSVMYSTKYGVRSTYGYGVTSLLFYFFCPSSSFCTLYLYRNCRFWTLLFKSLPRDPLLGSFRFAVHWPLGVSQEPSPIMLRYSILRTSNCNIILQFQEIHLALNACSVFRTVLRTPDTVCSRYGTEILSGKYARYVVVMTPLVYPFLAPEAVGFSRQDNSRTCPSLFSHRLCAPVVRHSCRDAGVLDR
jgi:hypothetical protein